MIKVKIKCGTCNKATYTRDDGRVVPAYALYTSRVLAQSQPQTTECWDCGTKRREIEDAKKQERLKRLFAEET